MATGCRAVNQAGNPCAAQPWRDGWCRWHHPDLATDRAEWSRRGGSQKSNKARARRLYTDGVLSPVEVEGLVGTSLRAVIGGKMTPGQGQAVAALARAAMTVREVAELEQRIADLEERAGIARGESA